MSMRKDFVITVGGENLIDSVHTTSMDGTISRTDNLGGSPFNVAIALARQNVVSHYLTPISTDTFGDRLVQHLHNHGVILAGGRRPEPTTQAVVTLDTGIPDYVFNRTDTAERAVTTASISASIPRGTTHLHVGSLAFVGGEDAAAWETVFHAAAEGGIVTSVDPNVRVSLIEDSVSYRARLLRLFSSATVIKLSDEDLAWIFPDQAHDAALLSLFQSTSASLVALTKGADGAECWTPTIHASVQNPKVETLVDTIGAGDTFMATLLIGIAKKACLCAATTTDATLPELTHLLNRCVQAACLNCAFEGCNPPTTASLDAALARGAV